MVYEDILENTLSEVCHSLNCDIEDIRSKSRKRELVNVRHIYCFIARKISDRSYAQIAEVINRDHATAIYAEKSIMNLLSVNDSETVNFINKLRYLID